MKKRVFIIGGGASGLAAAAVASEKNSVTVLEKNPRVGKKILMSGNGRCNLSNRAVSATQYNDEKFFESFSEICPPEKVWSFFEELGLMLAEDNSGRIYPATGSASSVLDVLRLRMKMNGVTEQTNTEIAGAVKSGDVFLLTDTDGKTYECDRLIVASGSPAANVRQDGGLVSAIKNTGHRFVPFTPVLGPLKTDRPLGPLKNNRFDCVLTGWGESAAGEVQFKEDALSGIVAFEMSFFMNKYFRGGGGNAGEVIVDFLPYMSGDALKAEITRRENAGYTKENLLTGIATNRLADFARVQQESMCDALKNLSFKITGTAGTSNAQVCDGGFATEQVDKHMQSKLVKGLYFTGECLNFAGNCGGFNLHAAWATGIIAGESLCQED